MNYLAIVNPISGYGRGKEYLKLLESALQPLGHQVDSLVSEYHNHPHELAAECELSKVDRLIIIGGDGTIHEVINGLMKRRDKLRPIIACLPAGTGNSIMHDFGLVDPGPAIDRIIADVHHRLDLFLATTKDEEIYIFNIVGWGLPASINIRAEGMRFWKAQRYNLASLIEIFRNPSWSIEIDLDDYRFEGKCSFFLACNTIYTGNGMKMAPRAKIDDGKIDVVILKKATIPRLIQLFTKIFSGKHLGDPLIEYHQVKKFTLQTSKPQPLVMDGQVRGNTPVEVELLSDYLEIIY